MWHLRARLGALFALALPLYVTPVRSEHPIGDSAVGRWVEAKGSFDDRTAVVRKLEERRNDESDTPDKFEITAPVAPGTNAESLHLLDLVLEVTARTTFENEQRVAVEPFILTEGEWVEVKARRRADGRLHARVIRSIAPRDSFEVVGFVESVDVRNRAVQVGGVELAYRRGADFEPLDHALDPLARLLDDDQNGMPLSFWATDSIRVGGQLFAGFEDEKDFDLERDRRRDRNRLDLRAKLAALWTLPDRRGQAFAELAYDRRETSRQGGVDTVDAKLDLARASMWLRLRPDLFVGIGRQDFEDDREWIYDEVLDGIRVIHRRGPLELDAGFALGRRIVAAANSLEDTRLSSLSATWWRTEQWRMSAYVLHRRDGDLGYDLTLAGLRSYARPGRGPGHWVEVSTASGRADGLDSSGTAFDVGGTYTFGTRTRLTFGAGFAHGSGRSDSSSKTGYRQSGLQDNNARLGGVSSVRFYGELFDPELANLQVRSLFATIRPFSRASISLLLHDYRQPEPSTRLPTTSLRIEPNGEDTRLGSEIDLVLGYRPDDRLTIQLVGARFTPGPAFDERSPAHFFEASVRYSF
ncbi:hypothetical protein ASA1KI_12850 [Opitutales bacterium ASA1]|uniref:alginate export family protein n=1 Tax=Congregicoccus parvus TaxID=3081749 RepID=UPI002B2EA56E|nr:hypothetical protein ASA1KI_12850 [Opitutales bacterium ASA1]